MGFMHHGVVQSKIPVYVPRAQRNPRSRQTQLTSMRETSTSADHVEPLVRFQGVQKSYDGKHLVVRDLNLDIYPGEFLSLLGPSGSGKTTCLMMLAGFEAPTGGDIFLENRRLNNVPPHHRGLGMVFQNYALFPHMTVARNLEYPLKIRKIPRPERMRLVAEALEMVQMPEFGARYPGQLSGGQQQRIALARALVFKPKIVLMDEPLGALDKQLREHMQLELKSLHRKLGVTFVYVTHDQSEALTMSNRVAVFSEGVIQQVSPPEQLYEAPTNAFVASFVGDTNQFAGTVRHADHAWCDVDLGGGLVLRGMNKQQLATGAGGVVMIRPEHIKLATAPDGGQATNDFNAQAVDEVYFGDHVHLRCTLPNGNTEFFVKTTRNWRDHGAASGASLISLSANPDHVHVFRDS